MGTFYPTVIGQIVAENRCKRHRDRRLPDRARIRRVRRNTRNTDAAGTAKGTRTVPVGVPTGRGPRDWVSKIHTDTREAA